ncbi:MAG: ATP-dependent DNA helicase RecG [Paludibacteraceae bacterium]|nr:ATP-dependent DNA helicase RecG [Paludibacteraceae bacterium]MBO4529583.1 ATP-dependent DNA helicase RecG [Paludibacteraceae bacterium]MBR5972839.1 ATP-dependent DNA helicase RecG [Paludibacteraceae bacterium]
MMNLSEKDITYLHGVGPKRSDLLKKEIGVTTYADLLYYFPYRYIDKSRFYAISELNETSSYVQIRGRILKMTLVGTGRKQRVTAIFSDGVSAMELLWFKGTQYVMDTYKEGHEFVAFGKPSFFAGKVSIVHPEMETIAEARSKLSLGGLQGLYNTSEKMKSSFLNSKSIQKLELEIIHSLGNERIDEVLPNYLIQEHHLMPLHDALLTIHFPKDLDTLRLAQFRLKFEELFFIQIEMLRSSKIRSQRFKGMQFEQIGYYFNTFYKEHLPFELTAAQKRVIREIRADVGSGRQMNRLLQGDVGSGKTLVALMTMLMALDNGYQACMMAPTEILATQHYESLSQMLSPLGVSIVLLTGSTKKKEREQILPLLAEGEIQILIGTHALIEDGVVFKNLGMAVIDEQHRFGVAQRARLWAKNVQPPHVLVMTATPIPRTLAMTLYGDLDVSVIDQLPPGRKPIRTVHRFDTKRADIYEFMKGEIAKGRQIYIVYPMIQESEKSDYENLESGYAKLQHVFPEPMYHIGMVHGKMKPAEKDAVMQEFVSGRMNVLVATTVIEVGVNVPNASVMMIESAERFGLSQLHQLRGRVGRGADQSYCVLMTSVKLSKESRQRMDVMVRTNDGFEISEVDLKMRGPGDIEGTQQSGVALNLKITNLATDGQIVQFSRDVARMVLDEDPDLMLEKNRLINLRLQQRMKEKQNWGVIS